MSPLAVARLNVPAAAVIGALMAMPWSAWSLNVFTLLHESALATVMVPPEGAEAADDVETVTLPSANWFCRSVVDSVDVAFAPVMSKGEKITSPVDGPDWMVISLGSSNSV